MASAARKRGRRKCDCCAASDIACGGCWQIRLHAVGAVTLVQDRRFEIVSMIHGIPGNGLGFSRNSVVTEQRRGLRMLGHVPVASHIQILSRGVRRSRGQRRKAPLADLEEGRWIRLGCCHAIWPARRDSRSGPRISRVHPPTGCSPDHGYELRLSIRTVRDVVNLCRRRGWSPQHSQMSQDPPHIRGQGGFGYLEGLREGRHQAVLSGNVFDRTTTPDGAPAQRALFETLDAVATGGGRSFRAKTDRWGPYQLVLPPGEFEVWAERAGRRVTPKSTIRVRNGDEQTLTFTAELR